MLTGRTPIGFTIAAARAGARHTTRPDLSGRGAAGGKPCRRGREGGTSGRPGPGKNGWPRNAVKRCEHETWGLKVGVWPELQASRPQAGLRTIPAANSLHMLVRPAQASSLAHSREAHPFNPRGGKSMMDCPPRGMVLSLYALLYTLQQGVQPRFRVRAPPPEL